MNTKTTFLLAAALLAGCAPQISPYEMAQKLAAMPEAESLVKVVSNSGNGWTYSCSGASIGKGLFLTTADCIGRTNYVLGLDGVRHNAAVVKSGKEYTGASVMTINDTDANYAVLYAPDLILPPIKIADWDISYKGKVCIVYYPYSRKGMWTSAYQKPPIEPNKVCGTALGVNHLHQEIFWDGAMEKQNGFWGAPVFNGDGELAGIISYKYTEDFQRAGMVVLSAFKDEIAGL